jgi:hypothetical protein
METPTLPLSTMQMMELDKNENNTKKLSEISKTKSQFLKKKTFTSKVIYRRKKNEQADSILI